MEQFGRYELRRRLGVGGMAEVYEAIAYGEHGVEKPLVIKRILEEHGSDPDFREMFIDEARIAMRLNHPNVVQVFEFGKADERYFLAMELVRGRDLAGLIARAKQEDRTIPAGVAVFIAGEVAKGLDYAHRLASPDGRSLGLVHRDVSPANVLLSMEGAVKVGDFGIANFDTRKQQTQVATVRGKVRYMSPEQADGAALDGRSDLFSLGAVLYEMITGRPAFDGRSDLDVLAEVRRASPQRPSDITVVPPELERILAKAMAADRERRYARGNDLQRDLELFAADQGLRASSGALAEFLVSLFPELERSSDALGTTQIRRMVDVAGDPAEETTAAGLREGREVTQIRRILEKDGLPVFVSEEIPVGPPREDTTTVGAKDVSALTRSGPDPSELETTVLGFDTAEPPTRAEDRRARTVVRPAPEPKPVRPEPDVERERRSRASMARPPAVPASDGRADRTEPRLPMPPRAPEPEPSSFGGSGTAASAMEIPSADFGATDPGLTGREPAAPAVAEPSFPDPVPNEDPPSAVSERAELPRAFKRRERPEEHRPPLTTALIVLGVLGAWFLFQYTPVRDLMRRGAASGPVATTGTITLQGVSGDQVIIRNETYIIPVAGKVSIELPPGLHDVEVAGNDGYSTVFSVNIVAGETLPKTLRQPLVE